MQKVAKEWLADVQSGKSSLPLVADAQNASSWDLSDPESLLKLLQLREITLLKQLGKALKDKMASGQSLFDIWMKHESDTIQGLSRAHGERICMEQCFVQLRRTNVGPGVRQILTKLCTLFALHAIETELPFYVAHGFIAARSVSSVGDLVRRSVADLAPQALALVESFAIPEHLICAPIAQNWVRYNEVDNKGELVQARL
jgi:acyl-CoA oxidase